MSTPTSLAACKCPCGLGWSKLTFRAKEPVKALDVLSQMLESPTGVTFGPADVPVPCPKVYRTFIVGFLENGDVKSALLWFDRMRAHSAEPGHVLDPMVVTPKPDYVTWITVIEALAERCMIAELNPLFHELTVVQASKNLGINGPLRILVANANAAYLRDNRALPSEQVDSIFNFLVKDVLVYGPHDILTSYQATKGLISVIFKALLSHRPYL